MSKWGFIGTESKTVKRVKRDDTNKENSNEATMLINSSFLLKCPPEIRIFYEFCCSIAPDSPLDALYHETGLRLVGPFEVLRDPIGFSSTDDLTDCYRYFHDPPELVTVLAEDGEHPFHIGYFRDDYAELPQFLVSSRPSESGRLTVVGGDIFSTVINLLEQRRGQKKSTASSILHKLTVFMKEKRLTVERRTSAIRKPTCKTLNDVGLKINLRGDIGYRPVPATSQELVTILNNATDSDKPDTSRLDELMVFVQFANDEGDYGEGLELGLDLLAFHPPAKTADEAFEKAGQFNRRITCLLTTGYQLAGRSKFAQVIRKHMENRLHVRKLRQIK
ncbi:hypothetical protein Aperf_G00000105102 [Anoplocephala perfoliata]